VNDDFLKYLFNGIFNATSAASSSLIQFLAQPSVNTSSYAFTPITGQPPSYFTNLVVGQKVPIVVFNSLAWSRSEPVRLIVNECSFVIRDAASGTIIPSQISKIFDDGRMEIFFDTVTPIPALGVHTYFVEVTSATRPKLQKEKSNQGVYTLENNMYTVQIDEEMNIIHIKNKKSNVKTSIMQEVRF
jgi:hypothetical protein